MCLKCSFFKPCLLRNDSISPFFFLYVAPGHVQFVSFGTPLDLHSQQKIEKKKKTGQNPRLYMTERQKQSYKNTNSAFSFLTHQDLHRPSKTALRKKLQLERSALWRRASAIKGRNATMASRSEKLWLAAAGLNGLKTVFSPTYLSINKQLSNRSDTFSPLLKATQSILVCSLAAKPKATESQPTVSRWGAVRATPTAPSRGREPFFLGARQMHGLCCGRAAV